MRHAPIKDNPALRALLLQAVKHKMTPEEKEAQRKSWVIGEMMLENLMLTREEAEARYERARS